MSTVDVRINASPAVDTFTSNIFLRITSISEDVAMRCYVILTNILREMCCNEGLYHCFDGVAG